MQALRRLEQWLRHGLMAISVLTTAFLVLFIPLNIVMRFVFGRGWGGAVQVVELGMVLIVFFGLAQAEARKEHVDVELVTNLLSQRLRAVVRVFERLIYLVFVGALSYYTLLRAMRSLARDESMWAGVVTISQWPFRFIIPVGLLVLCLTILVGAWKER